MHNSGIPFMLQEFRANLRRLFNVTNKPESNQHEAQSLLSNRSHEHLDLYAEGEHDTHNIVYWVRLTFPFPFHLKKLTLMVIGVLHLRHCHATTVEW